MKSLSRFTSVIMLSILLGNIGIQTSQAAVGFGIYSDIKDDTFSAGANSATNIMAFWGLIAGGFLSLLGAAPALSIGVFVLDHPTESLSAAIDAFEHEGASPREARRLGIAMVNATVSGQEIRRDDLSKLAPEFSQTKAFDTLMTRLQGE